MFADSSAGSVERRSYVPAGSKTSSPGSAASRAARMAAASSFESGSGSAPKSVTSRVLPVAGPGVGTSIGLPDRSTKPGTCQSPRSDGAGSTASSLSTGLSDSSTVHAVKRTTRPRTTHHEFARPRRLFRTDSFIKLLTSLLKSFRPSRRPWRQGEKR